MQDWWKDLRTSIKTTNITSHDDQNSKIQVLTCDAQESGWQSGMWSMVMYYYAPSAHIFSAELNVGTVHLVMIIHNRNQC